VLGFTDGMAWLAQIGLFTLLGLLVVPAEIPGALALGLATALVLLVLARPLSVLVSLLPFRFGIGEQAFLSWGGLRGAVPIVFATIPLSLQTPEAVTIFTATFLVVVALTALQGPLLPWVAGRTGMAEPDALAELEVESAPLDDMRALLLGLEVPAGSQLVGLTVADLRLPPGAVVTLVVRGGQTIVPDGYTRIRPADRVLVVAAEGSRTATLHRLREVSAGGRLVGWRRSGRPDQPGDDLRRHPDQRQAAPRMRRASDQEQSGDR
jgi:cell volume regulation protein A